MGMSNQQSWNFNVDAGSAAIYGLKNKKDVPVFVVYRCSLCIQTINVSPLQEAQMTTMSDVNEVLGFLALIICLLSCLLSMERLIMVKYATPLGSLFSPLLSRAEDDPTCREIPSSSFSDYHYC